MRHSSCLLLLSLLACVVAGRHAVSAQQPPTVSSVSGCAMWMGNITSGCMPGDVISVTGTLFTFSPNIVTVGGYSCTNVTVWSSTLLTATLPFMSSSAGGVYGVLVYNGQWSLPGAQVAYALTANATSTSLRYVTGCASQHGNVTSRCYAGTRVYLWGDVMPVSNFSVLLYAANYPWAFVCTSALYHNSSCVSAVLPTMLSTFMSVPLNIVIYDSLTNDYTPEAYLVQYAFVGPYISTVAGCVASGPDGMQTNCAANTRIQITGSNFTDGALTVHVGGSVCTDSTRRNDSLIECSLPALGGNTYELYVNIDGYQSNTVYIRQQYIHISRGILPGSTASLVRFTSRPPLLPSHSFFSFLRASCLCHLLGYAVQPYISSLSGCPYVNPSTNSTSGCVAGTTIILRGVGFSNVSSLSMNASFILLVTVYNDSVLASVLPFLASPWLNTRLTIRTWSNGAVYSSNAVYITYAAMSQPSSSTSTVVLLSSSSGGSSNSSRAPFNISYVTGCPSGGCSYGDRLTIVGSGFASDCTARVAFEHCNDVSVINSSMLSCIAPPRSTLGGPVTVTVFDADGRASNMAYVNYTSQRPVVWAVSGCSPYSGNGNATTNCSPYKQLVITGSQFLYSVTVTIGQTACAYVTFNKTRIWCSLPYMQPQQYGVWLPVLVSSSMMATSTPSLVMYGAPVSSSSTGAVQPVVSSTAPVRPVVSSTAAVQPVVSSSTGASQGVLYISSITGCPVNNVSGCSFNQTLTIRGGGFVSPVNVSLSGSDVYRCSPVIVSSANELTCRLPVIGTFGAYYSVQVTCGGLVSNSMQIAYANQQPTVWRVSNCTDSSSSKANGTYGCVGRQSIIIEGAQFLAVTYVYVDAQPVAFTRLSSNMITATLAWPVSTQYGRWLSVVVISSGLSSSYAYLVMYGQPPSSSSALRPVISSTGTAQTDPIITQILGCPVTYVSGGAGGCSGGMSISILGSGFASSASAYLDYTSSLTLQSCSVSNQGTLMTCTLINIPTSGNTFRVYVVSNGRFSNRVYLGYADQTPVVYSARGCAGGMSGNATYGCTSGTVITVIGNNFYSPVAVQIGGGNSACLNVEVVTVGRLHCSLPSLADGGTYSVIVRAQANAMMSAPVALVTFASNGGGGSTTSSSKSSLTLDELVIIVVVVVIVIGLLLVCQVMYCLYHFAGVKFPRIARLTGGRLFAAPSAAGPEGHEINLSLLANAQQGPQPAAAAPYQPAVYQLHHHEPQAAYVPPVAPVAVAQPPPFQILYPRSFVPSPQYYQSVS